MNLAQYIHRNKAELKLKLKQFSVRTKSGCREWTHRINPRDGHGILSLYVDGRRTGMVASRLAWILEHGWIEPDVQVCHDCPGGDNPACIDTAHMFTASAQEHSDDKRKKRQYACGKKHGAATQPEKFVGEGNGRAKLTPKQVRLIRASYKPRVVTQTDLARRFGVSEHLVYLILKRKIWGQV